MLSFLKRSLHTIPALSVYNDWSARHSAKKTSPVFQSNESNSTAPTRAPKPTTVRLSNEGFVRAVSVAQGTKASRRKATEAADSSVASIVAKRRVSYFVRRGNKARRESLFRSLWTPSKRKSNVFQKYSKYEGQSGRFVCTIAKGKEAFAYSPDNLEVLQFKSTQSSNRNRRSLESVQEALLGGERRRPSSPKTGSGEIADQIRSFSFAATPYIGVVGRRRGRRTVYKIRTLPRNRGQRQSLIALANTRHGTGAASKPFVDRFKKQRSTILTVASKDRKVGAPSSGSLRDKRDEGHQTAYANRPAQWRRVD